jgi:hypothetical protein
MGLTRTIAASPGYGELHTYGCRECGVWVTEGSTPRDQPEGTFIVRRGPFSLRVGFETHACLAMRRESSMTEAA